MYDYQKKKKKKGMNGIVVWDSTPSYIILSKPLDWNHSEDKSTVFYVTDLKGVVDWRREHTDSNERRSQSNMRKQLAVELKTPGATEPLKIPTRRYDRIYATPSNDVSSLCDCCC